MGLKPICAMRCADTPKLPAVMPPSPRTPARLGTVANASVHANATARRYASHQFPICHLPFPQNPNPTKLPQARPSLSQSQLVSRGGPSYRIAAAEHLCDGGGGEFGLGRGLCGEVRRVAREVVEHAVCHEGDVLGEIERGGDDEEGEEEEEDRVCGVRLAWKHRPVSCRSVCLALLSCLLRRNWSAVWPWRK